MARTWILPIAVLVACAALLGGVYLHTRPQEERAAPAQVRHLDRVAQAVATTSAARSFNASFSMTYTAGDNEPIRVAGTGSVDLDAHRVALTFRVVNAPGSPAAVPFDVVVDYSDSFVEYMHSPGFAGRLPAGKSWIKVDLGRYAAREGIEIGRVMQGSEADPSKILEYLRRAGDPVLVGEETVSDESMSHYRSQVDVRRLIESQRDPAVRASLTRAMEMSGTASFPIDVWIDRQGYLRRAQWTQTATLQDAGGTPYAATASMTEDLSAFGRAPTVTLPRSSTVVDADDLRD